MMGVGAKRALGLYRSCAPRQRPSIIHSIPIEDVIRESVREFDPPRTLSELAVLVCDAVGKPTRKCGSTRKSVGEC